MLRIADIADVRQGMATAGRAVGARPGDWAIRFVESANVHDDRLCPHGLPEVKVKRDRRSEAHLLEPFDILVTARSSAVKVALVPPGVSRMVAAATLLVVRTPDPGSGLAHFLWYYLASGRGRAAAAARVTTTSLPALSARALGEVPVAVPAPSKLRRLADLIDAAEASRTAALEAVHVRHDVIRDAIIGAVAAPDGRAELWP